MFCSNSGNDEVEWTGNTGSENENSAKHSLSDSGTVNPGKPGKGLSISEVRELPNGKTVTVNGVVTVDSNAISIGSYFNTYIQDESGGINLFASEQGNLPDLNEGDKVKVTGRLDSYKGLMEIVPSSIEMMESDQKLPEIQTIILNELQDPKTAESYEGELVHLTGFISSIPAETAGGGYNVPLVDADYNGTILRIMENALNISEIESEKWYNVTGIVSQYNAYQIIPTEQTDIELADEQPKPPSPEGPYKSVIMSVTDGDTVDLEKQVLGALNVRLLNIDTPETYPAHNDDPSRDEINENQKAFGEKAGSYLKKLLQPGDEVLLKVGKEPTDKYGRLLAQVIREDDNKNINLEMVRQGYAVTYFIAPFNEIIYPEYQHAVKKAIDNGLVIWNPKDPLLELPFVFRAHDDQKGFSKYVGNSDTMEYVLPENWADVPVSKRIFFWDEQTAREYGYTSAYADPLVDKSSEHMHNK